MKTFLRLIIIFLVTLFGAGIPRCYAFSLWWSSDPGQAFWSDLRSSFQMEHYVYTQAVTEKIYWFQHHQKFLQNSLRNAEPYLYYIYTQVIQHHLPGEFVLLPIIESDYDPFAYSDRGAAGLWQLMPDTASGYGLKEDWWYDGRRDISASTSAALNHILYLKNFFNNNWLDVLAAYDAGDGRVQRAIQSNAMQGYNTAFWYLPLPHETQAYVPRLLALAAIISDPDYYGIKLPDVRNAPYFAVVYLQQQIDLVKAARLAGISLGEMQRLNPGFNRWTTDPNGPYRILLPIANIAEFKQNYTTGTPTNNTVWQRYRVQNGQNLESIATIFNTSVASLQKMNNLNTNLVWPGQIIYVPIDMHNLSDYPAVAGSNQTNSQQPTAAIPRRNYQSPTLRLQPEPTIKKIVETVRIGDSIWKFAKKYNLKADSIRSWNHLHPHQPLTVGQTLTFWQPLKEHSSKKATDIKPREIRLEKSTKLERDKKAKSNKSKKFKKLEASKKAERIESTRMRLKKSKKLKASKKIAHHKTNITHYHVKSKDNLYKIAKRLGVSAKDIQKWNGIKHGKYLKPGQKLVIYKKL